ncbi:GNAT family N-acetyltransferase [Bacillus pinisoli]|uniref:GNAT family N-acetyltransferase n=1 Tax=Bacillus pinisoli TaxID=2901866 RepID=UPI001FF31188
MIIKQGPLTIRPLAEEDAEWLTKWLSDDQVLEFYEGRDRPFSLEQVKETFYEREEEVFRNIVFYEDQPIGYIQYYPIDSEERLEFSYRDDETIYGMDQFIGEVSYWNRGIGTELINTMVHFLSNTVGASKIIMDPQTWNVRAIRCYEKCGFVKKMLLPKREWHEGEYRDCWLIEYSN